MGKIMNKVQITIIHSQNSTPRFFVNNASFGHLHDVSKNFITVSTFSIFQVQVTMRKKLQVVSH